MKTALSQQGSEFNDTTDDETGTVTDETFYRQLSEIIMKESLVEIDDSPVEDAEKSVDVIGIMPFFGKYDVINQFPSGPGRTNIICACIFKQVDRTLVECQALVLSPTREQAQEVERVMRVSGADQAGIKIRASSSIACHLLVATPADVMDMIRGGSLMTDNISMFVLDDADQMLSLGFKDQILEVFHVLPSNLQLGVFTETAGPELLDLTHRFMQPQIHEEQQPTAKRAKT